MLFFTSLLISPLPPTACLLFGYLQLCTEKAVKVFYGSTYFWTLLWCPQQPAALQRRPAPGGHPSPGTSAPPARAGGSQPGRPPCPRGPPHLGAPQPPQRARSRRPAGRGTAPVPAQSPPCRGAGPAASTPGRAPCGAPGLWWKRLRSRVRPARWRRRPAQLRAWGCRWRAEPGHGVFKGSGTALGSLMGVGSLQGCGEGLLGEVCGWCRLSGG